MNLVLLSVFFSLLHDPVVSMSPERRSVYVNVCIFEVHNLFCRLLLSTSLRILNRFCLLFFVLRALCSDKRCASADANEINPCCGKTSDIISHKITLAVSFEAPLAAGATPSVVSRLLRSLVQAVQLGSTAFVSAHLRRWIRAHVDAFEEPSCGPTSTA